MPLLNKNPLPAVPLALATALLHSTLTYISNCTDSAIVEDPVRHCTDPQATQPTITPDNLAKSQHTPPAKTRRGGPIPAPPTNRGKCHNIHAQHCARNDNEIDNIRLYRGPVGTWDARTTDQPLHNFLHDLRPLTQLLDIVFKLFLLPCWKKYDKVRRKMPGSIQELSDCFGLWRSRAIVIDACTNVHRDLKDVCYGWCAIVPLGDFEGGDVCLPGLGYKITLPVGTFDELVSENTIPLLANPHNQGQSCFSDHISYHITLATGRDIDSVSSISATKRHSITTPKNVAEENIVYTTTTTCQVGGSRAGKKMI